MSDVNIGVSITTYFDVRILDYSTEIIEDADRRRRTGVEAREGVAVH